MNRRHFLKMAALGVGGAGLLGRGPLAEAEESKKEPESPIYLALNPSRVANNEWKKNSIIWPSLPKSP